MSLFACGHEKTPGNMKPNGPGAYRCRICHKAQNKRTQKARDARYLAKAETKRNRARLQREYYGRSRYKVCVTWRLRNGWPHDLALLKPLKRVNRSASQ